MNDPYRECLNKDGPSVEESTGVGHYHLAIFVQMLLFPISPFRLPFPLQNGEISLISPLRLPFPAAKWIGLGYANKLSFPLAKRKKLFLRWANHLPFRWCRWEKRGWKQKVIAGKSGKMLCGLGCAEEKMFCESWARLLMGRALGRTAFNTLSTHYGHSFIAGRSLWPFIFLLSNGRSKFSFYFLHLANFQYFHFIWPYFLKILNFNTNTLEAFHFPWP